MKEGEDAKKKTYEALCIVKVPEDSSIHEVLKRLQGLSDSPCVELDQWTPIRVLHRRSNASRTRNIYWMKVEDIVEQEEHQIVFKLQLCTQAGTYVKEFVHGDFGRTRPSLSTILGCENVDIAALDVVSIDLQWPNKIA